MTAPTLTPEDAIYELRAVICAHFGNLSHQDRSGAAAAHEALDVLVIALASAGLMDPAQRRPTIVRLSVPEDRR